jgi:NTE family protein
LNLSETTKSSAPGLGLALGAGGARGLAHVVLLEALDDLGVKPVAITGTSIGAILGACYAAGLSGRELRTHLLRVFARRHRVMALLLEARVGRFTAVLRGGLANPVMVDAELMLSAFWPVGMPERFEDLAIPFSAVVTDFYARDELVLNEGPLRSAVAGSMAIPGLVRPVLREGRTLVDGAATNPLPYDQLPPEATRIVACDVVAGPVSEEDEVPTPFQAMFGSAQIMQSAITAKMLRERAPDLLIRPPVNDFKVLDFFRLARIFDAAEVEKDKVKRALEALLDPRESGEP